MKMKIAATVLALLIVIGLTSCDFVGSSLSGTTWTKEVLGIGTGLHFTSGSSGTTTLGTGPFSAWSDVTSFTYTYDSSTKTGVIIQSGYASSSFSISGNDLTYSSIVYKYKAL